MNKAFYSEKSRNHTLRSRFLRNIFLALILAITFLFQSMTRLIFCISEGTSTDFEFTFPLLLDDTLAIYIQPPVENISVDCNSLKSNRFRVAFYSNETQYGGSLSLVYMMPRNEGMYVLLVSFSSSKAWNCTIGVYASDSDFYRSAGSITYTSQGYFITLKTFKVSPKNNAPSNYRIKVILQVYDGNSSIISLFKFPAPINMALFIATGIVVAYINAFFFIDLYFKSKREGMSKTRWVMAGLLLFMSLFILYQAYMWASGD